MSMKEFDYKQFLLEKGERVGLGVAVTLMVLMLILSLFMPGKGFFSGSPRSKAKELASSTEQLESALRTRQPSDSDLPDKRDGKLIDLDTSYLKPDDYATENWFEPLQKEDKSRRPPKIYNLEEAVAAIASVPVDTYLFRFDSTPPTIAILQGAGGARAPVGGGGSGAGGFNPFAQFAQPRGAAGVAKGGVATGGSSGMGMMGGNSPMAMMQQMQQNRLNNPNLGGLQRLQGVADNTEYELRYIPVEEWNQQQLTARRLQPLRMAIIAGSFPYKAQLEEHKTKLRRKTIDEVINEQIGEGDNKKAAFDFLAVEVQRMEVDADGKKLTDWLNLPLKESYENWLKHTYLPFEPESSKYDLVKPNDGKGLVMPLLREFRAYKSDAPGLPGLQGMMPQLGGGRLPQLPNKPLLQQKGKDAKEATAEEPKDKYPDVAADLPKIRETLDKLKDAEPKQVVASKFVRPELLDVFSPNATPPDNSATAKNNTPAIATPGAGNTEQEVVPDYILARVVDVNIQPGKSYRYRLKVKMANPNYHRPDVASPDYKEKTFLESPEWFEMPQTVKVPNETFYYVVDEEKGTSRRDRLLLPPESAQWRMFNRLPRPSSDQVVFQFHRWVESTQQSRKDDTMIPVGDWAVADRVLVARGEYVGQKVNIDIPIWKVTQNTFILPAEDQNKINKRAGKPNSGIDVDFGVDPSENNTILVDFEGGKVSTKTTPPINDDCALEVLMLSGDGKLLARNSIKDAADQERIDRRKYVLDRIQAIREGRGVE